MVICTLWTWQINLLQLFLQSSKKLTKIRGALGWDIPKPRCYGSYIIVSYRYKCLVKETLCLSKLSTMKKLQITFQSISEYSKFTITKSALQFVGTFSCFFCSKVSCYVAFVDDRTRYTRFDPLQKKIYMTSSFVFWSFRKW